MFSSSFSSQNSASNSQTSHRLGNQPISSQSYMIITQYGDMLVVKQGVQAPPHHHHHNHQPVSLSGSPSGSSGGQAVSDQQQQQHQTRPIIMTFHDLGLNSELQFATFCESEEVKLMLQTFTMIHVNFIGQETTTTSTTTAKTTTTGLNQHTDAPLAKGSGTLPEDFKYPSVEQMAESIVDICAQLRVRSFIAIAVGAGAHIVGSLALMRPDLVDGLFLINPVITSCSITEWLYFKMSAIASNHRIGHWSSTDVPSTNQMHHDATGSENVDRSPHSSTRHHATGRGLRKLLNAAHIHLPLHTHHHNNNSNNNNNNNDNNKNSSCSANKNKQEQTVSQGIANQQDDLLSIGQVSSLSGGSQNSTTPDHQQQAVGPASSPVVCGGGGVRERQPPSGSRLRQLIFSRNFHLGRGSGTHQSHLSRASSMSPASDNQQSSTVRRSDTLKSGAISDSNTDEEGTNQTDSDCERPAKGRHNRKPPGSSGSSADSLDSQHQHQHQRAHTGKRPPIEYLMYHHFGTASLQRFRRSSDTPPVVKYDLAQRDSNDNCTVDQQPGTPRSTASSIASGSRRSRLKHRCSQSQDTLEDPAPGSPSSGRNRSGSVICMERSCLASFSNDRQRHAYMQNAYKRYFNQLDAHNLWLFAQSFAKRRNLNLRKDCGAAAHAAAAAATLGTSIYTAFVGPTGQTVQQVATHSANRSKGADSVASEQQPLPNSSGERSDVAGSTDQPTSSASRDKSYISQQDQQQQLRQHRQQAAAPQVAGTKVKRTFACQTLIMCSSVQMHCERAFKLMSLLNPLQATWIKTDHLLVLDERPDKVCQALRLFLQGIGYSMSTYERRLRLSSATGSASSADSGGSAPSLNEKV